MKNIHLAHLFLLTFITFIFINLYAHFIYFPHFYDCRKCLDLLLDLRISKGYNLFLHAFFIYFYVKTMFHLIKYGYQTNDTGYKI